MLWNGLKPDIYDVNLLSFYCESNELGKLRCPDLCLLFSYVLFFLTWFFLISFCLTWFFPVSVFLILFCLTWFSPSGLRFSRIMVLVSGLCLKKNWLTASSREIDIKNYKMHPWQRWLGGFVDCHAGWLTSLRIGIRFILIILIVLIIFKTCLFFHDHLLQWLDWELTWMWRAVAQWYWNVRQPATVWIWKKMRSGRRNAEISKPILKKQDHLSSWEVVFNAICGWDWDGYQEHLQW